jgi:hypothetical protein
MGFITDGPHDRGLGRMSQFGDNLDQLTMEILRCVGAV